MKKWEEKDLLYFTYNTFLSLKMWNQSYSWLCQQKMYIYFNEIKRRLERKKKIVWDCNIHLLVEHAMILYTVYACTCQTTSGNIVFFCSNDLSSLLNASKVTSEMHVPQSFLFKRAFIHFSICIYKSFILLMTMFNLW